VLPSGRREMTWDGRDEAGREIDSGIYFLRLSQPGTESQAIKVLVMR